MPRRKTVVNSETTETKTTATGANTVVVAYNGVQGQTFLVPNASGVKIPVTINGNNTPLIGKASGALGVGGYGLTAVDADAWEWIKTNYANWAPIKNGLMFASTEEKVEDAAKERKGLRNGFEPLKKSAITGVEEKK